MQRSIPLMSNRNMSLESGAPSAALGHIDHENTTSNLSLLLSPFSIPNAQQVVDSTQRQAFMSPLNG